MKQKECRHCNKEYPATTEYFQKTPRNKDGLYSYCKPCMRKKLRISNAKYKGTEWSVAGFDSEKEHFNHAIQHYAQIFDCPQLLKHLRK